ncbi:MAG: efflux RND transporter permease subunit [Bacteroidales bacterium]|nr:efflux RND transporter permease subunit [Bacteroidales bacterium]
MEKRKINIYESVMKHPQIAFLLTSILLIFGVYALIKMPRQEFPEFTIRQGLVIGIYPGASAAEVEDQLTRKVENFIFGYEEVNKAKTYSISKEGVMIMFVELNDKIKDSDKFWSKLKHGLNELKPTLPAGVLMLKGDNDFGNTSAVLISLSAKDKTYKDLKNALDDLEADIRKIESVSKIKHYGIQHEEYAVHVQQEKLNQYNIKSLSLFTAFRSDGMVNYAGDLDNGELILPVHLPPRFENIDDLKQQIIYADPHGDIIRLKDVAQIERKYKDFDRYIKYNRDKAVVLSLEMQNGNNIVDFGKEVDKVLDKFSAKHPDITISKISNAPQVVDKAISHFLQEFAIAIIAVIIVIMLLLPFRVAGVAAVTIPISVLMTLSGLYLWGVELHTVSLAALIVTLGMIVDNSIVIIDNHIEKLDEGETAWNAAWKSVSELFLPVFVATLAIFSAYFPTALYMHGTVGDFTETFPVAIGMALFASLLVAGFLVPVISYTFIKKGLKTKKSKETKFNLLDVLQNFFNKSLDKAFHKQSLTIWVGILSIVLGIYFFTQVKQQLFPKVERNQFAVEIYLPEGYTLDNTASVMDSLETALLQDKRVVNVTSFVGTSSPRFHTVYAPNIPAKNYGQMIVNTISDEATIEVLDEFNRRYKDAFPEAHIKWKQLDMQSTPPIEIRISGDDIEKLKTVAYQVEDILENTEGTEWVRNDWKEKRQTISVKMDKDKANRLGFNKSIVSTSLAIYLKGLPLTTVWEGDYPVDVVLTGEKDEKNSIEDLKNMYITSPATFSAIPLRAIAQLYPEWQEGQIVRRNGVRTVSVIADVGRTVIANDVLNKARPLINKINLPKGVSLTYGGEYEHSIENYIPMGYALLTSIVLIFLILVFQFKEIKKAILIMLTMPLSLLGASLGLYLTGYPFGITAFLGVISLAGIVVRNGIILIDYAIQLSEKEGLSVSEAAKAAGKRRMRPIFLTSAAAAVGVIPMIISGSPLWGPLGTVICFGLIISMVLTLYVLPVLYAKMFD